MEALLRQNQRSSTSPEPVVIISSSMRPAPTPTTTAKTRKPRTTTKAAGKRKRTDEDDDKTVENEAHPGGVEGVVEKEKKKAKPTNFVSTATTNVISTSTSATRRVNASASATIKPVLPAQTFDGQIATSGAALLASKWMFSGQLRKLQAEGGESLPFFCLSLLD